jgi:hypothetical protein
VRSLWWLCAALSVPAGALGAGDTVLVRDATVHTQSAQGVLEHTDILIRDGRIAQLGTSLSSPVGAAIIEAHGRAVTPGLFGGVTRLGIEEIGEEPSTDDYALKLGTMRPEFDVTRAFNPDSVTLGVARRGGVTFAQLAPSAEKGGSVVSGQGAIVRLDGSVSTARSLFVETGGGVVALSGGSRAAQLMLVEQALLEVRSPKLVLMGDQRALTPGGREAVSRYLGRNGRWVFSADRASDIREILQLAERQHIEVVIRGAGEGWRVANELARAHVPVLLDPFTDLPDTFDSVGATLENAALLNRAGVTIAFSFNDPEPHNIRKLRQGAGIAVAHGLPWEAALAALTHNPAEILGVAAENGSIVPGRPADLVLWSGDPLEVTSLPDEVFIQGIRQSLRSRQTELRDRYLPAVKAQTARKNAE